MSIPKNRSLSVGDVMMGGDDLPVISKDTILKQALEEMCKTRLGIICITNDAYELLGILTDGDIRRKLLKIQKPFSAFFVDDALAHAIKAPIIINPHDALVDAIDLMETKRIWDLPVVDDKGRLVGLLHLHPAVRALLVAQK